MALFQQFVLLLAMSHLSSAQSSCSDSGFNRINASDWIAAADPGWNLGNTLDAEPTEGSWNNPPVDFSTFDDIKASGFNSIRVPGK
jgi:endoglucanase